MTPWKEQVKGLVINHFIFVIRCLLDELLSDLFVPRHMFDVVYLISSLAAMYNTGLQGELSVLKINVDSG
jgi:hypothetical protein